jgi:hypothetical protein
MAESRSLRPALPVLFGAAIMLTLSMGIRQTFGLFVQPISPWRCLSRTSRGAFFSRSRAR